MAVIVLYRGVSNIFEAERILVNHTAGGQTTFDAGRTGVKLKDPSRTAPGQTLFANLDPASVRSYIREQRGTEGERLPIIVEKADSRPLVEYTTDHTVAKRFGLLGMISIRVDDSYAEPRISSSPESGVFCLANAPVQALHFQLCPSKRPEAEEKLKALFMESLRKQGIGLTGGAEKWGEA